MRWNRLFADLEAQYASEMQRIQEGNIAEVSRLLTAQQTLQELVLRKRNGSLKIWLLGEATPLTIVVERVGQDWISGKDGAREVLINLANVFALEPSKTSSQTSADHRVLKVKFTSILREFARQRVTVQINGIYPMLQVEGTIDRVGQNFCELSVHESDQYRRKSALKGSRWIVSAQIATIFSRSY